MTARNIDLSIALALYLPAVIAILLMGQFNMMRAYFPLLAGLLLPIVVAWALRAKPYFLSGVALSGSALFWFFMLSHFNLSSKIFGVHDYFWILISWIIGWLIGLLAQYRAGNAKEAFGKGFLETLAGVMAGLIILGVLYLFGLTKFIFSLSNVIL